MAAVPNADSRRPIPLSPSPSLSKDFHGPDDSIPLSPQWLLAKPVDNRPGILPGGPHLPVSSINSGHQETGLGIPGELHENDKKKDLFRPSAFHDRWRDEERDSSLTYRKDRWRVNSEKESSGDVFRKMDRWNDNSSTKQVGEQRRAPSDRWADTGSRDNIHDQRRESKWSTRWGPEDKESDGFKESKWFNSGNDNAVNFSKENDKEIDPSGRPWRSSFSQGRGRGVEVPHQQSPLASMQSPTSAPNNVGGEKIVSTFSVGRGRGTFGNYGTNHHNPIGKAADKRVGGQPNHSTIKYSRTKLLDIYRVIDFKAHKKLLGGFVEVPDLIQADPVEPLAFSAPSPDETSILRGIDKGDIVSSGAPQVSKDNSIGRLSSEARRNKYGSKEDLPFALEDNIDVGGSYSKSDNVSQSVSPRNDHLTASFIPNSIGQDVDRGFSLDKRTDGDSVAQAILQEKSFGRSISSSNATLFGDQSRDLSNSDRKGTSAADLIIKATGIRLENQIPLSLSPHIADDFLGSRDINHSHQFSDMHIVKNLSKSAPEDLNYYYRDPQGEIQGPFSGNDLVGWLEAGYFGLDLQVREELASADTPFYSLGDAIPHLKMKARPPPGFKEPKQSEYNTDALVRAKATGTSAIASGVVEIERLLSERMRQQESITGSENKFLESMISGGNNNNSQLNCHPLPEGLHQIAGNKSEVLPTAGLESGDDVAYLLAQKLSLERQMSLPSSYGYWSGREAATMVGKADVVAESPILQSNILPSAVDNSHHMLKSQTMEMRNMLKVTGDNISQVVNNEASTWSKFSDNRHISASALTDGNNIQGGYRLPQLGFQQQTSSMPLLMNKHPVIDHPSGNLPSEDILPSLPQEPQIPNLSLYSQQPVPTHTSVMDMLLKEPLHMQQQKELLLQQQQQLQHQKFLQQQHFQQQQQFQLQQQLLQQQQQHFFSQMIAQTHLQFGEPSHMAVRSSSLDHHGLQHQSPEPLQIDSRLPHNFQVSGDSYVSENLPSEVSTGGVEAIPSSELSGSWTAGHLSQQPVDIQQSHSISTTAECSRFCTPPLFVPGHHVLADPLKFAHESTEAIMNANIENISEAVPEISQSTTMVKASTANVSNTNSLEKEVGVIDITAAKDDGKTGVKKASDKKSRKQKKASSSERGNGASGLTASLPSNSKVEVEVSVAVGSKLADVNCCEVYSESSLNLAGMSRESMASSEAAPNTLPRYTFGDLEKVDQTKSVWAESNSVTKSDSEAANHRAWKPAPGVKPKSLLEIQQEEQERARAEITASESSTLAIHMPVTPWTGNLANAGAESGQYIVPDDGLMHSTGLMIPQRRQNQLHDLLAEEVLEKKEGTVRDSSSMVYLPDSASGMDAPSATGDDFIEAKDTKKSRKKALKGGKVTGPKMSSSPVSSFDMPGGTTLDKVKNYRQSENEPLPAPSPGPSLGDFVMWKSGDQTNVSPAPAWSTESSKNLKPISLRDIQKEQEKTIKNVRHPASVPVPSPKTHANLTSGSGGTLWNLTGSSSSKAAASPVKIAAQPKTKMEDDLFWGPINHSKEEYKQADFPSLENTNSRTSKVAFTKENSSNATPRQKSIGVGGKFVENAAASSPGSSLSASRRKRDSGTIHSEATGFKDWCESECLRLTGTKDTSILEYCSKLPSLEAKPVLIDYLGRVDTDHVFIEKFLNYKELLSADVIETAFGEHLDGNLEGVVCANVNTGSRSNQNHQDVVADGSKGGGKKKGKKGKKMSSAVLGFNVVSNRIMMGEIQTIDD